LNSGNAEGYYARAQLREQQGKLDLAIGDLRTAVEIQPKTVFEAMAQAEARKRIEQLARRNACGDAGAAAGPGTCL
jgi:hypothetical protein